MRKTLINSLNALSNLETVTVTDFPFRGMVDPPPQRDNDTSFDPLQAAFNMRQEPGASPEEQSERMEDLRRGLGDAEVASQGPQVYGLEVILSIFHGKASLSFNKCLISPSQLLLLRTTTSA